MKPSLISISTLVIGKTSKSYKVSTIFIGYFDNGVKLATVVGKKVSLVEKDAFEILQRHRIIGNNGDDLPILCDCLAEKDGCRLYSEDWDNLETWKIV